MRPAFERTIRREVRCTGIGLHTGRPVNLALKPASAGEGIVFRRVDLGGQEIPATRSSVVSINYATTLTHATASVATTEHLLAAVYSLGVDDLLVELDGPELPIMDGSAAPFVFLLHEAGIRTLSRRRRYLRVVKPLSLGREDKSLAIYPSDRFRLSYTIRFQHPLIGHQTATLDIDPEAFASELAPARTFCFLKDVEHLRQRGLTLGGSLDNAIVVDDLSILNDKLRFEDEFVRHKMIDAIGDFALLGMPLLGHIVAYRAGHALHAELVGRLLASPDCWVVEGAAGEAVPAGGAALLAPRVIV